MNANARERRGRESCRETVVLSRKKPTQRRLAVGLAHSGQQIRDARLIRPRVPQHERRGRPLVVAASAQRCRGGTRQRAVAVQQIPGSPHQSFPRSQRRIVVRCRWLHRERQPHLLDADVRPEIGFTEARDVVLVPMRRDNDVERLAVQILGDPVDQLAVAEFAFSLGVITAIHEHPPLAIIGGNTKQETIAESDVVHPDADVAARCTCTPAAKTRAVWAVVCSCPRLMQAAIVDGERFDRASFDRPTLRVHQREPCHRLHR